MNQISYIKRAREQEHIDDFLSQDGSGFMHMRGRRRIGKSWLLRQVFEEYYNCFYFQGDEDATSSSLLRKIAQEWDTFTDQAYLTRLKSSELSWSLVFRTIGDFAERLEDISLIVVFDEIQWLAKKGTGFVSQLKEAWVQWEKTNSIKTIIAGSSNRFFVDNASGNTTILRGLRTYADLWVRPFSLQEVSKFFFPKWTKEQVCLVYMMTGGIPYYLQQIPRSGNFIRAINKAFFTRGSIFQDEVYDILNLEFATTTLENVLRILAVITYDGKTIAQIQVSTGYPESTIRDTVKKLVDYNILYPRQTFPANAKANKAGTYYYVKDFFINFYLKVLLPLSARIVDNKEENIFAEIISSKQGYYIENFTGQAFEALIECVIENHTDFSATVFKKLDITQSGYKIGVNADKITSQVDVLIYHPIDREFRLIEVKWLSRTVDMGDGYISEVLNKRFVPSKGSTLSYYLVLSQKHTAKFADKAKAMGVGLIGLEDLFNKS